MSFSLNSRVTLSGSELPNFVHEVWLVRAFTVDISKSASGNDNLFDDTVILG